MVQQTQRDPQEAYPGKDLGSRDFIATDEILSNYYEGLQIDPAWYTDQSPYGSAVAPSMTLTAADGGFPGSGFKNNFGTLWMRQEWDSFKPIIPGERYRATSKVVNVYEHRNRTVVNQQVTLLTPDGEMTAQGHHHQSFLLDQSSGKVQLRDPKAKEGARRFLVPDGEALESTSHVITLEMCGSFFHGNANYHTDKEAARELGFEEVVVGGRMTLSYLGDLMDKRFGRGWYEGGRLDVKFTNIVWPGDRVIAQGVVTDSVTENGGTRAKVAIWMEKEDGTVVIVGTTSALV